MIDTDQLRGRLRERLTESNESTCGNCLARITTADYDAGHCTQCGSVVMDLEDESAFEHLHEDEDY